MYNDLFYDYIENQKAKEFIDKIPSHIKPKCRMIKIQKQKIIVLKGNQIKSIYISCQGSMQVRNEFENGFVYNFASIKPIAYIGVMEMMANKQTYSSTLQTSTECIILEIPKEDFRDWINTDQELTLEILHFVSKSMYEQSLKTGEVLAYPAICILISYLINVFESEDEDTVFLEKTREEIGSILGFSIRTINRNLKDLKEENLIYVNRKGISITKEQFYKLSSKLETIK
jgi:CRP/FNR family cyclic AMP-dependent transcriptional regulator